ncbi:MAG TPA: hypothetical protein PLN52_11415 [Opitutaceae bacterium]|nr:hypothetical protein [Opitutaceae bacterium]
MVFFPVAFGLLLHLFFWGAGLAWWITPRAWRAYWPLFAGLAGLALQSAVVWWGAYADWAGTQSYGRWSLLLPALLLATAWWRRGTVGWKACKSVGGVLLAMVVILNVLVIPYAASSRVLTTSSLGSCDAADYAAGARVLTEFARSDRSGFIGLTEVVQVQSVDNFFDYWLRLNHFTPSAVLALNGAVFGLAGYQITSLMTAIFLVLGMPIVFWLARSGFRYGPGGSLVLTLLYGLSPILWYAVAHVSMSQLLAAPAIALITWVGVVSWRTKAGWRMMSAHAGLLAVAYWLILGGYNFIIVVCLLPVGLYALGSALWTGAWACLIRWALGMIAPLVMVGILAFERVAGLWERFQLFQQYDFGWKIPALSPEGWLGLVANVSLVGYSEGFRWAISGILVVTMLLAWAWGAKRCQSQVFLAACLSVPIIVGYVYLLLKGRAHGTNASYDAYKLFAVFYPGILAALGYVGVVVRTSGPRLRWVVAMAAVVMLAGSAVSAYRFAKKIENPALMVSRSLARLSTVENMPEVTSVNMMITDFWSRIWANVFLLHRAQYFPTHTYEGRLNTPLRGQWDLFGGLVSVTLPDRQNGPQLDPPYWLVDTTSPYFLRASLGEGWYDAENIAKANLRWRWSKGEAEIVLENPQARPLNVGFKFQARSLVPRDIEIWVQEKRRRRVSIGTELGWVRLQSVQIPPGITVVKLKSNVPAQQASPADTRKLGFAAYGIVVEVRAEPDPVESQ